MASLLVDVAASGSRSHSGAPTSAASGMMTSASFTSGRISVDRSHVAAHERELAGDSRPPPGCPGRT